jgi:septal ring factor EnvC (AmiA/AmiB activator)
MTQKDYENKIDELQQQLQKLQKANLGLVNHNLQLSKQINAFYDVRRRVHMLKELVTIRTCCVMRTFVTMTS